MRSATRSNDGVDGQSTLTSQPRLLAAPAVVIARKGPDGSARQNFIQGELPREYLQLVIVGKVGGHQGGWTWHGNSTQAWNDEGGGYGGRGGRGERGRHDDGDDGGDGVNGGGGVDGGGGVCLLMLKLQKTEEEDKGRASSPPRMDRP